jgi:hypothetical protein
MFPNSVRSPFKLLELSALVSKEMPSARHAFPLTVNKPYFAATLFRV